MPRFVDHHQRRREVTEIAARLVASRGRSALTVRNVADAAGCSTTVVSHYFDDMSDLLHETYGLAASRARARIDAVLDEDPSDVVGLAEALLPLDQERQDDWRVWFAFWSEALASPALAAEQRRRARVSAERFHRCLTLLTQAGRMPIGTDLRRAADRIAALIPGIAAEAIFDTRRWTAARQRRVLRDELESLGVLNAPDAI